MSASHAALPERPQLSGLAEVALSTRDAAPPLPVDIQRVLFAGIPHEIVSVGSGENIFVEGEPFTEACVLLEGWACRYKTLLDGRRQIIGFILPGELCSSWAAGTGAMGHGVRALCPARIAKINRAVVLAQMDKYPALIDRLRVAAAQEHTILGAWLLNIGQRKAPERIAHLFCELATRMRKIGLERIAGGYEVPLTQTDLADALGLTSVHVNRVLQKLRDKGFIGFRRGVLSIRDVPALCSYVEFKDGYLYH